ncbi:hypothetical protein GCM10025876_17910 [Demequina litorisediminis]|uniref:Uncharacterized protein n=1 Tax=Demequina litorisediminis TaxID=1849022 RepID=A0ABQ6IFT1_9MICO|nr:hypothetical protein GCM10025876_17910 [Demequina litorisediminis]
MGLARSGTTRATVSVRPNDRDLATLDGRYWSSSATAFTRAVMVSPTVERPFITRDTVARDTPAASATSAIVAAAGRLVTLGIAPPDVVPAGVPLLVERPPWREMVLHYGDGTPWATGFSCGRFTFGKRFHDDVSRVKPARSTMIRRVPW